MYRSWIYKISQKVIFKLNLYIFFSFWYESGPHVWDPCGQLHQYFMSTKKLRSKLLHQKGTRKMLIKLTPGLPLDYGSILWERWLSFSLPSVLSWFDPRCSESRSDVQPFSDRLSRCTKSLGYPCHLPVFNFTNILWGFFSTMGTLFITKLFCYNKSQRACVTFGIKRCHMNQLKNTTASYKC
jgi:hypothetical protein